MPSSAAKSSRHHQDQVHSDEKAEDHVTLTHRTREKERCSNQQSETGK